MYRSTHKLTCQTTSGQFWFDEIERPMFKISKSAKLCRWSKIGQSDGRYVKMSVFCNILDLFGSGVKKCQKIHMMWAHRYHHVQFNKLKWGAYSRWLLFLYHPMRNSDQMVIRKTHTPLLKIFDKRFSDISSLRLKRHFSDKIKKF